MNYSEYVQARSDKRQLSLFGGEHTKELIARYSDEWISAEKYHPKDAEWVLVRFEDERIEQLYAHDDGSDQYFLDPETGTVYRNVKEWLPLPIEELE